jgi:RNA polymerase sigma factor (sigma-70 family)
MAPRSRLSRPEPTPQQRLVMIALPMVEQCADELARLYYPRVKREDLLGAGTIGADRAARRYDKEKHPSFPVYARHYIRGWMLDSIRAEFTSLRARVEHAMERAHDTFSGHQAFDLDLFADPVETIVEGAREGGDDALAAAFFAAVLEAQGASPEEVAVELEGQSTTIAVLRAAMAGLLPLEREVIRLVYTETIEVDEVAKKVGVSPRTVQRRHASALGKLREILLARGVEAPKLIDL